MPWRGHSRVVAVYAFNLAERLGLPIEMQRLALLAGVVHDIGKASVPEFMLTKTGKLTKAERHLVEHHSVEGESMLIYLAEIVRHHHERVDGKGYPDGLEDDLIPYLSKIICVTDAYNAMTSDRPYRKAMKPAQAIEILKENIGTQFDPEIVEAFIALLEEKDNNYRNGRGSAFADVVDKLPG